METKICSKCKRELPFDNFRWKNKSENKKHSQCKDCEKQADKEYYLRNGERRQAVRDRANIQKINNSILVENVKSKGCAKCGELRTHVLDLHHVDPEGKINTIAHMIKSASEETLIQELNKCIVLCANCHRDFHYQEKLNNITIQDYIK